MWAKLEILLSAQRALRSRFDDAFRAMQRENRTAMEVALADFEQHLRRWTEAEEKTLIPALERVGVAGRDPRRELRLEYVQIRELTRYLMLQMAEGVRATHLQGFAENLNRRLRAHESEMTKVYYPAAASALTQDEWATLEDARPNE